MNEQQPVNYKQSQTQFSAEEPIFEQPPTNEAGAVKKSTLSLTALKKLPKWSWLVIGLISLLLILAIIAALMKPDENPVPTAEPVQVKLAPELTPFEQRLESAQQLLREANPTTEDFPFPPVDMELRIDPR
jgi:hypothetical protein